MPWVIQFSSQNNISCGMPPRNICFKHVPNFPQSFRTRSDSTYTTLKRKLMQTDISGIQVNVEVRDSRTGYLLPARDGPGALPDGQSCWDAVAVAVAVSCQNVTLISFSFRAWIGLIWEISGHSSVGFAWNFGARLFWNHTTLSEFKDIRCIKVFLNAGSEKCSCPSMYIMHIHIHMHIHIQIHIPYMGPGRAAGSGADGRAAGPGPM